MSIEMNDPAGEGARLNQVSVFLLAEGLASFDAALRRELGTVVPLRTGGRLRGELRIYWSESGPPRWLAFVNDVARNPVAYDPAPRLAAILFLVHGERRYAITFGYARHYLRADAIEPDFGLKVAAGLVDVDELASVDARSTEATAIQIRRQSSRGLTPGAIGLDIAREMLRGVSGRLRDPELGSRITGSDSVSLTAPLDAAALGARLTALQASFDNAAYRERFRHIDRWSSVRPGPLRARLDGALLDLLGHRWELLNRGEEPASMPGSERPPVLEAPEVVDWRAAGFRTSREPDDRIHPFPDLDAYLGSTPRQPTLADLETNHSLHLISDEAGQVIASWPLYRSINWELELDGDVYVLAEGRWWRVDAGYRARIDDIVGAIETADLERPAYDPVEWEVDYNLRLARHRPGRAFLDRRIARFESERGGVEPCDVFTASSQFVHVKRETSSAALSHLFAQGTTSARLFLMLREFRERLRELLAETPELQALVPDGRPDPEQFEVVLGIVSTAEGPLAAGLPFFARNHLAQVIAEIEGLGYRGTLAPIDEVAGARPADAGLLFREREGASQAQVTYRGTPRGRRRAAARPETAEVIRAVATAGR